MSTNSRGMCRVGRISCMIARVYRDISNGNYQTMKYRACCVSPVPLASIHTVARAAFL